MNLTENLDNIIGEVRRRLAKDSITKISRASGISKSCLFRLKSDPAAKLSLASLRLLTTLENQPQKDNTMTAETLETPAKSRIDCIAEIKQLEARIYELKASIPSPYWKLFMFRVSPGSKNWQYAESLADAEKALNETMTRDYGDSWSQTSEKVDVYDSPEQILGIVAGNVFKAVPQGPTMYSHFLDEMSLAETPKKQTSLNHKPALQRHAEEYQQFG
ncbi:MAG: hypothetical protein COA78_32460 [Blastopirellula sp.]|nr:MAG: hypothetical protein COA78_32460 [Blastopirellula sp.]